MTGARVGERDVDGTRSCPRSVTSVTGDSGGRTDDSVSSTSTTRSAATDARGIIDSMNVTITTDIRICSEIRQVGDQRADLQVAVGDPVGADPQHGDARDVDDQPDRREQRATSGGRRAARRPSARRWRRRSASDSCGSRTNARTTRMPVICSRSTVLMRSIRVCITWKAGTMRSDHEPEHDHRDRDRDDEHDRQARRPRGAARIDADHHRDRCRHHHRREHHDERPGSAARRW